MLAEWNSTLGRGRLSGSFRFIWDRLSRDWGWISRRIIAFEPVQRRVHSSRKRFSKCVLGASKSKWRPFRWFGCSGFTRWINIYIYIYIYILIDWFIYLFGYLYDVYVICGESLFAVCACVCVFFLWPYRVSLYRVPFISFLFCVWVCWNICWRGCARRLTSPKGNWFPLAHDERNTAHNQLNLSTQEPAERNTKWIQSKKKKKRGIKRIQKNK